MCSDLWITAPCFFHGFVLYFRGAVKSLMAEGKRRISTQLSIPRLVYYAAHGSVLCCATYQGRVPKKYQHGCRFKPYSTNNVSIVVAYCEHNDMSRVSACEPFG